MTMHIVNNNQV